MVPQRTGRLLARVLREADHNPPLWLRPGSGVRYRSPSPEQLVNLMFAEIGSARDAQVRPSEAAGHVATFRSLDLFAGTVQSISHSADAETRAAIESRAFREPNYEDFSAQLLGSATAFGQVCSNLVIKLATRGFGQELARAANFSVEIHHGAVPEASIKFNRLPGPGFLAWFRPPQTVLPALEDEPASRGRRITIIPLATFGLLAEIWRDFP